MASMIATHEGGPNTWFAVALLVPLVTAVALSLAIRLLPNRRMRLLGAVMGLAATVMTLHVSVVTWRAYKDEAMCRSWDPPEALESCIGERRAQGEGPWGIFLARRSD